MRALNYTGPLIQTKTWSKKLEEDRVEALQRERASLIGTKREQLAALVADRDAWVKRYQDEAAKSARLMRIVRDTLWMAQRYADGRKSYAVSMYNDAARDARSLGIDESDAKDGMFDAPEWDIQK